LASMVTDDHDDPL
jgi:hypothetical protein